jgi:hypothetical protein
MDLLSSDGEERSRTPHGSFISIDEGSPAKVISSVPRYVVNLDEKPSQRWNHIVDAYKGLCLHDVHVEDIYMSRRWAHAR